MTSTLTEKCLQNLPEYLKRVDGMKPYETQEYHPQLDRDEAISLLALNDGETTQVRVVFKSVNEMRYESRCILDDIRSDTENAADLITEMSHSWIRYLGQPNQPEMLETLDAGARKWDDANYAVAVPLDPEKHLSKEIWARTEDGGFEFIGNDDDSWKVKINFVGSKGIVELTHNNEELGIEAEHKEEFFANGESSLALTAINIVNGWEYSCLCEENEVAADRLEEFGPDRKDHMKELKKLHRTRAKAFDHEKKVIDKMIDEVTTSVQNIDLFVKEYHMEPSKFIKEFGGALPDDETKSKKKAANKAAGEGNQIAL